MSTAVPRAPNTDRPALCTPEPRRRADDVAHRSRAARQLALGVAGLLFVLPIAALLMFGAGGPLSSPLILGPIVTSALPIVAMVAFWSDDGPGTSIRPAAWSVWVDTLLIAIAAVAFTVLGHAGSTARASARSGPVRSRFEAPLPVEIPTGEL